MDPTVEFYKEAGANYSEGDISPAEAAWMKRALDGQKRGSTVFEFGSGLGLRSRFIEEEGFVVQRSDVAGSFLELLSNTSPPPLLLDLQKDPLPVSRIFYASAVLLHFPKKEMPVILKKVYDATKQGGVFFFSLKTGTGEGREDDGRYFAYWQEPEILALLLEAGWQSVDIDRDGETWIQIIARKN